MNRISWISDPGNLRSILIIAAMYGPAPRHVAGLLVKTVVVDPILVAG